METTITVTVTLKGMLRVYFQGQDTRKLDVPAGSTVSELLGLMSLPDELVGAIIINGESATRDEKVGDGGDLLLYPLVVGG